MNFTLLLAWLYLLFVALRKWSKANLTTQEQLVWGLLIIFVPILGALLFITRPDTRNS
jgi:hypothetical protein